MEISAAQAEVRTVYRGGFFGQLVSAGLWTVAGGVGTLDSPRRAALVLFLGGCLIFPLATLCSRLPGRRAGLSRENPLGGLSTQIAFVVPLTFPVALAALAGAMVSAGLGIGLWLPDAGFAAGAWVGAGMMAAFAFVCHALVEAAERAG